MKRAMIKTFYTREECILGELEHSGNPWSEFHALAKPFRNVNIDMRIPDNLIEKITE